MIFWIEFVPVVPSISLLSSFIIPMGFDVLCLRFFVIVGWILWKHDLFTSEFVLFRFGSKLEILALCFSRVHIISRESLTKWLNLIRLIPCFSDLIDHLLDAFLLLVLQHILCLLDFYVFRDIDEIFWFIIINIYMIRTIYFLAVDVISVWKFIIVSSIVKLN